MVLGFTGTREGMTKAQIGEFGRLLRYFDPSAFHHGCCVGADEDAALTVAMAPMGIAVIAHPGTSTSGTMTFRSTPAMRVSTDVLQEKPFYARNRDIVDACDHLIAAPLWPSEHKRTGGTWYTIEYAMKVNKPVTVIWPDGTTQKL